MRDPRANSAAALAAALQLIEVPDPYIVRFNDYHKHVMELLAITDAVEARKLRPWCMRYYARGYSRAVCSNMLHVMREAQKRGKPLEVTPSEPPL